MHHLDGHYAELRGLTGRKNISRYCGRRPFPGCDILVSCDPKLPLCKANQTNACQVSPCGIGVTNVD